MDSSLYEIVLSRMTDQVYVRDQDKNLIFINPAAEKLTGWSFAEAKSKKCFEIFGDKKKSCELNCPVDRSIEHKESITHHEGELKTRSGEIRKMKISITPLTEPDISSGAVVVMQDITHFKALEKTRIKTMIKLEKEISLRKERENLIRIQRDLAIRLGKTDSLDQAIEVSLSSLLRIDGIDCAGIYMIDPRNGSLRLIRYRNLPRWFAKQGAHYDSASPQTRLIMAGRSVFSSYDSLLSSLGMSPNELADKKASGIKALAIIPIHYKKEVIAAMNIASRSSNQFQSFTKYALEAIASQLGEAFAKIRSSDLLKASRLNLQALFENLTDFLFVLDEKGNLIASNPAAANRLGYSEKELHEMHVLDLHPPDRREDAGRIVAEMRAGQTEYCPIPLLTKTGDQIPVETHIATGKWNGQAAIFGISRDISERLAAQKAKQVSEDRLLAAIEAVNEGFALYDEKDRLVMFNPKYAEIYGGSSDILVPGASFEEIIRYGARQGQYTGAVGREEEWVTQRMALHHSAGTGFEQELGNGRWLKITEKKTPGGDTVGFQVDITDIKRSEEMLLKSLREKDVLLKEVHHRVKNNMQVISSLLNLQIRKLNDVNAARAFEETESRLHAMSLVHEILYRSDTLTEIDFQDYLERLAKHLLDMFVKRIRIKIKAGNMPLKMDQAVTCGLIVAELITNSLKHAFPGTMKGQLTIQARHLKNNTYRLCVEDNGIGFPGDINWKDTHTLGLRLVRELVLGQLEGKLDLEEKKGVAWRIEWKGKG